MIKPLTEGKTKHEKKRCDIHKPDVKPHGQCPEIQKKITYEHFDGMNQYDDLCNFINCHKIKKKDIQVIKFETHFIDLFYWKDIEK